MDSDDSSNDWTSGDEPQREHRNVANPRVNLFVARGRPNKAGLPFGGAVVVPK